MTIRIGYVLLGILVLFLPGFLLSFILFPKSGKLDVFERIGVSVGMSALIDMIIILILAQPALKLLKTVPVLGSIFGFCAVCVVIMFFKKESFRTFLEFFQRNSSTN